MRIAREYRERAEELRTIADHLHDQQAGDAILRVAQRYEAMALWRERQDGKLHAPELADLSLHERDGVQYSRRAEELRTLAEAAQDQFCRDALTEVADRYDEIARVLGS
jgi:hypothetical protein